MIVIEISAFGPPQVLRIAQRPKPTPQADEVLIRVAAAGVARADIMQRQGKYPPPPGASDIPGLDVAGVVDSVGSQIGAFKPGDRVCAILAGGGYAEYCVAPASQVLPTPEGWSDIEAASLPENLFTAYDNLITRAALQSGETALIHGGVSGLGSVAVMLAQTWNATAFATVGSDRKCVACMEIGAAAVINYRDSDFVEEIIRLTGNRGVDVIFDLVGGSYLARNLDALGIEGRVVIVATQGGRIGELDLGKLMQKRARVIGSTMRARTPEQKGLVAKALQRDVWPLLPAKNRFRPLIDSTFSLADAWRAHERLESGEHMGKIVLVVDDSRAGQY